MNTEYVLGVEIELSLSLVKFSGAFDKYGTNMIWWLFFSVYNLIGDNTMMPMIRVLSLWIN